MASRLVANVLLSGVLTFSAACQGTDPPPGGELILLVELKTDLVPGVEFAAVRTQLFDAAHRTEELTRRQVDVTLGRDLTAGRRVAELGDLRQGTYLVRVALVNLVGDVVLGRDVVVTVRETAGVTVLMTRDCVGVVCPGADDDPMDSACLSGRCVEVRCAPETPEFCPAPECAVADECGAAVSRCARDVCEDGTCFIGVDSAMCMAGEYCDPAAGCEAVPSVGDGGALDAGDAAVGSSTWAQEAYVKASNTDASDNFGWSVSLSGDGNTLAVAGREEASLAEGVNGGQSNNGATGAGAVYVFTQNGGRWEQQAYLKASNTDGGDQFGWSVSLSDDGNTLVVGAINEDSDGVGVGGADNNGAADSGAVYLFTRAGESWSQQAYIKASNTDSADSFGYSVSLSGDGDILAVGAINEDSSAEGPDGDEGDNGADGSGAVYVFTRSMGSWSQQAYLKASNPDARDRFGHAVSLSADGAVLAVSALFEASSAIGVAGAQGGNGADQSGAAYVFARTGGSWSQQAYLKASNTEARDQFGTSLSLSGDGATLAVGAAAEDSSATGVNGDQSSNSAGRSGAVYVFARAAGTWSQQAYLKASNTDAVDQFAASLSLSGDGRVLAVGAVQEASAALAVDGDQGDNMKLRAGAAYVFFRSGVVWAQERYLKASNTDGDDFFAWSVCLTEDAAVLAVGAIGEGSLASGVGGIQSDNTAGAAGAAYVFRRR